MYQNYIITQQTQPYVTNFVYPYPQHQYIYQPQYLCYNSYASQQPNNNAQACYQNSLNSQQPTHFQQQQPNQHSFYTINNQNQLDNQFAYEDINNIPVNELKNNPLFENVKILNENMDLGAHFQSTDSSSQYFDKSNEKELLETQPYSRGTSIRTKTASYSYSKQTSHRDSIQLIQSIGKQLVHNSEKEERQQEYDQIDIVNSFSIPNTTIEEEFQMKAKKQKQKFKQSPLLSHQLHQSYKNEQMSEQKEYTNKNMQDENEHSDQSKVHSVDDESIQQPSIYSPTKNVIFYENLKAEMQKIYKLKNNDNNDDLQLVSCIEEDLKEIYSNQCKPEFIEGQRQQFQNTTDKTIEQQTNHYQQYLKCIFLNFSSQIHQYFNKHSQGFSSNNPYTFSSQKQQSNVNVEQSTCEMQGENPQQQREECEEMENEVDYNNNSLNQAKQGVNPLNLETKANKFFFNIQPKSKSFLKNFDFSDVRQNQVKNQKKVRDKKPNSSYIKNSQYHNLNKLFMYNILSMFRTDSLNNLNIPPEIVQELTKIILQLKLSSRRDYQNPTRGFFDYFSHSHYKVLFLKINSSNLQQIRESAQEVELHSKCFNIDLTKEISEAELTYINIIKEINYNIFMVNIREELLFDDGSESKQNIRRKYTKKVINGIKKLAKGITIKRF